MSPDILRLDKAVMLGDVICVQGKRAYFLKDGVLLFEKCKYCGTDKHPEEGLYGEITCVACGAPIGRRK
jgi:hypothetical protein